MPTAVTLPALGTFVRRSEAQIPGAFWWRVNRVEYLALERRVGAHTRDITVHVIPWDTPEGNDADLDVWLNQWPCPGWEVINDEEVQAFVERQEGGPCAQASRY